MDKFFPNTALEGMWQRSVPIFRDTRGSFREISRINALPPSVPAMVQSSLSVSKKNVLRGMHYQDEQWQLITLIKGSIQDIVLCIDEKSSNYLKYSIIIMEDAGTNQILTPPGFAHGFANLGDEAILHYKSSVYYNSSPQHGVNWRSDVIKDLWEKRHWIVSERDSKFRKLLPETKRN